MNLTFRASTQDDDDLIYGAWMRGWRNHIHRGDYIDNDTYYGPEGQRAVIAKCLALSPAVVMESGGAVIGFLSGYANHILHWIHIKPEFRGLGLSWKLLKGAGVSTEYLECSHATNYLRAIRKRHCKQTYYNQFLLIR
jgi:hypothetical protein